MQKQCVERECTKPTRYMISATARIDCKQQGARSFELLGDLHGLQEDASAGQKRETLRYSGFTVKLSDCRASPKRMLQGK
jgi:hypothetical protein